MALSKEIEVLGFPTTNYVKPVSIVIDGAGKNEEWINLYNVQIIVVFYTNETKNYKYDSKSYKIDWLLEEELSLTSLYWKLISLPDFEWYNFV